MPDRHVRPILVAPGGILAMLSCALIALTSGLAPQVMAQDSAQNTAQGMMPSLVITTDRGGALQERLQQVEALRRSGQRVEIRGYCVSACTLYLGLPHTCVSRTTVIGFHGPQSQFYGVGLPRAEFERWSRIMADHYPVPLRAWFMARGRNLTMELQTFRGVDLIRMGVPECA
ncbi:MAG: hypothetical protein U1D06_12330 [Paracoccaceae bacterium]|nr:hypothetical protein [Paracoccaceae bacterium]